jgi:hypothetical protein
MFTIYLFAVYLTALSVVSTATVYRLNGPWFESRKVQGILPFLLLPQLVHTIEHQMTE